MCPARPEPLGLGQPRRRPPDVHVEAPAHRRPAHRRHAHRRPARAGRAQPLTAVRLSRRSVAVAPVTALAPRSRGPRRRAPLAAVAAVAPAALATVAVGPAPGQLGGDRLLFAAGGGEQLEAARPHAGGRAGMTATTSTPSRYPSTSALSRRRRPARQRAAGHPARCPSARGHRRLARSTSRHHGCSSARCRSGGT